MCGPIFLTLHEVEAFSYLMLPDDTFEKIGMGGACSEYG